jgi:hypothetical protein
VKKQARAKEPEPKHRRKCARKKSPEPVPTHTARDESKGSAERVGMQFMLSAHICPDPDCLNIAEVLIPAEKLVEVEGRPMAILQLNAVDLLKFVSNLMRLGLVGLEGAPPPQEPGNLPSATGTTQ